MGRPGAKVYSSRTDASQLSRTIRQLLHRAIAPSTWKTYKRAYRLLMKFKTEQLPNKPMFPMSSAKLSYFIAYMYNNKYSANTVSTYCSSIQSLHKLMEIPEPGLSFVNKKLLLGVQKSRGTVDKRLPITRNILHKLIQTIPKTFKQKYTQALLSSMSLLAFHAFLRIGEMTTDGKPAASHTIHLDDIRFVTNNSTTPTAVNISLKSWKHSKPGASFTMQIPASSCQVYCPVVNLAKFIKLRGLHPGPLFCMQNNVPCSRGLFSKMLKQTLMKAGLDPARFKTHSFRIGATTEAAARGIAEINIQQMGRWQSNAFHKYIRQKVVYAS